MAAVSEQRKQGGAGSSAETVDPAEAEGLTGRAIQVVVAAGDHTFELDEEALRALLLRDEIKDRYVVVVSVAGAFRKGKSFLLDFFLRYMEAKYMPKKSGTSDWLGQNDEPLKGFSWRGGSERETTGILIWSEVFLADLRTGEKVAILLMDTQGAFDSESTVRDCATIFALSTMLSSIQIYNLSQNIQEDDLQHLQLFTEYGRLALEGSGQAPFQRLQFLVRDWSFPYEYAYGADGGKQILEKRLQVSNNQHPELQALRKHITSCFSEIGCFLMPHPGLNVAVSANFTGKLSEIETDFKRMLRQFIPMLVAPENLVLKQINGQKVKARDLMQYFKSYIEIYRGDDLPEPKSMLVATAEANNLSAVAEAKEVYQNLMEDVCGGSKPYMNTAALEAEHLRVRDKAMHQFLGKRKMGGDEFSEKYRTKLEQDLEDTFAQYKLHNEGKNLFKSAKTPAVLTLISIVCYILSGIANVLGTVTISSIFTGIMWLSMVVLITWAYARYSGELREIGAQIDEAVEFIWATFMKPIYQAHMQTHVQQIASQAMSNATAVLVNGKAHQS